ncbi:MAG TPA: hypothetical protein VIE89_00055 [Candidatus Binatia bacterium]|jgi:hypothetical protein
MQLHQSLSDCQTETGAFGVLSVRRGNLIKLSKNLFFINPHPILPELSLSGKKYVFPYVKATPSPTSDDPVTRVYVDRELGGEGFSYELQSGKTGTVHAEQVLDHNLDPNYLRDLMVYQLTIEAQRRIADGPLSKREIIRSCEG